MPPKHTITYGFLHKNIFSNYNRCIMIGYEVLRIQERAVSLGWRTPFKKQREFLYI